MGTLATSSARRLAGLGLAAAVVGIPLQIAGGVDYPVVPPGLLISAAAAALYLFVPWRWTPVLGLVVTLFFCVGAVATANVRDQLGDPGQTLAFSGTVIQVIGLLVAFIYGLVAARESFTLSHQR
ncbi:hypothetical protein ACGFNU_39965 [Spirillospora sp. NPDC048911]|uniref:hypothetical protein n=1 Tax=Spirillospora sp. NPDC048911 TaxID=3364527 RepID=UPI0037161D0D